MKSRMQKLAAASVCSLLLASGLTNDSDAATALLPPIQRGTIAVHLAAVATGLGAPAYGINAPGDTDRLFIVEQSGLLRVMRNNVLLPSTCAGAYRRR